MKTKSVLTAMLLMTAGTVFAQNDWLDKFAANKDITQVTLTKSLLNMVPGIAASVDMNGVNVRDIITKLEQLDIFTSDSKPAKQLMRKEITAFFKNDKSYEVLMKIKDKEDNVSFYAQKDGNFFKSLIMFVDGDDDCVIIRMLGKFTAQDLQKITEGAK
jgi:cytochrome b involved in lipid metabolism